MHEVHVNVQLLYPGDDPRYLIIMERVEIVRLLLAQGADVTAKDNSLSTPLHLASSLGIPEMVKLLIERGADITAEDGRRRTPLHVACALSRVGPEAVIDLIFLTTLVKTDSSFTTR